jgi:hypothetical protein
MPQCQFPVFWCFCVLEKLHRKYSQNWTKQKPNLLFFLKHHEVRRWDGGGPEAGHTLGWRGPGPGRHPGVRPPGPPPDNTLPPIYSPQREKPKSRSIFLETYCKPPPSSTRDREDPELFPAPCQRGESLPEAFSTTMVTSGVMCE